MSDFLSVGEVARELAIPRWRLTYLIERGVVPGPSLSVPGRKLFSRDDVERIKQAFGLPANASDSQAKGTDPQPDGVEGI